MLAPCDFEEAKKATLAAGKIEGPVYIRFGREATPAFTIKETPFAIGQAQAFKEGKDVTIIACGSLVYDALTAAAKMSKEGISVEVINCPTIKPIDSQTIVNSVKKTGAVVSVEEHQINGGLGSAVAEVLAKENPAPQEFVGMNDTFGESGPPEKLLHKYGMDEEAIIKAVQRVIKRK